jgi:hypothetical protein
VAVVNGKYTPLQMIDDRLHMIVRVHPGELKIGKVLGTRGFTKGGRGMCTTPFWEKSLKLTVKIHYKSNLNEPTACFNFKICLELSGAWHIAFIIAQSELTITLKI